MRCRVLIAVVFAAALAGCGVTGTTVTGDLPPAASHRGCPPQDRPKPVSTAPAANTALVPGHPIAVLLCRYGGVNSPHRFALVSRRLLSARTTVDRLAHELDTLRKLHGVVFHCPVDVGTAVLAFFRYARGPDDPVTVDLSGCEGVSNGHVGRLAGVGGSPVVAAELEKLTPR